MFSHSIENSASSLFADPIQTAAPHKKKSNNWSCKLDETIIGDYLIVPLTSAKMLKSEGYLMNNCCRAYLEKCAKLSYSIFSIRRRTGERLATLGLVFDQESWHFDQCMGHSNSEVLEESQGYFDENGKFLTDIFATELYYVSQEVVRLMNSTAEFH